MTCQGQVTGVPLANFTYCWKWDTTKTVADGRVKNVKTESSEIAVWTPSNLKGLGWKYFGFWSVDGKNAEPRDKVVCKLCKLQLAYHSTTSNMRAHLENVHPNEHAMMSGTPTKQQHLDSYFSPPATSCLSAARWETCTKKLASCICKDMRLISNVYGTGFREFCQELEPRYRIPKIPIQVVMSRCINLFSCYWHNVRI